MKKWIVTITETLILKDGRKAFHVYWEVVYAGNWKIAQEKVRIGVEERKVISLKFRAKVNGLRKIDFHTGLLEEFNVDMVEKEGFTINCLAYSNEFFNNFKTGKKHIRLYRVFRVRHCSDYLYCDKKLWSKLILEKHGI